MSRWTDVMCAQQPAASSVHGENIYDYQFVRMQFEESSIQLSDMPCKQKEWSQNTRRVVTQAKVI